MRHPDHGLMVLFISICTLFLMACGAFSVHLPGLPSIPNISATETQDAIVNAATPASPMSGDWATSFEGGTAVFHIARDGSKVDSVDLSLNGWHCGGTTMSTSMQVMADGWQIDNNQLSIQIDLNPPHIEELYFDGTYDQTAGTWSGTWEGDEYGTHCTGDWAASR